ncbi:NADH-quinone oxidoreductase subunit NuoK [Fangia hongkongensis]|uniref:NADH-quinone oxidoreductase subunit NuoK n=1 Tax=Fangia hongkongensis TaxID=270495 RepID=UPI0003A2B3D9|nr:NADH-quinone oxidoreductase subunit NuoK [Fangia hongkongensis]MBK2125624.1 NADH-quinone oxidoreductase subunit NuoK [Fangia hongkongensis]
MTSIPVPATHYLIFSAIIFCISIAGIIMNRRNLLVLLMSIELMLLAVNTNFVTFSSMLKQSTGDVFVFFILTVAAAEAAIGLAIVVVLFRTRKTIDVSKLNTLKG